MGEQDTVNVNVDNHVVGNVSVNVNVQVNTMNKGSKKQVTKLVHMFGLAIYLFEIHSLQ